MVFDITSRKSFEDLGVWIESVESVTENLPFILIGNKSDKIEQREVQIEEAYKKS